MASLQEMVIPTPRFELVATTLEHIGAELEGQGRLAALLGAEVPPSWPPGEYDRDALEFFRARLEEGGPGHVGWYGWYAITRRPEGGRGMLVAGAGYLGPPSAEGVVEIGYSVVPEARGQGYAGELVDALVAHAFRAAEVGRVIAHTQESNLPSARVLLRAGFVAAGAGAEPGTLRFERPRAPG